ncbi:MAG: YraN family protein [Ignavibacteria bacterium RBG_13_36_8]|nr:MAG: YraN family protein [Ignavibacteria bacterium RBG_13_36_8]
MSKDKKQLGNLGEELAVKYLTKKGYEILERNYRYERGEIDIIAKDKDILVFIEVKTRENLEYGYPEESVTKGKQKQIRKVAEAYLWEKDIKGQECRIDVIAILLQDQGKPVIKHIENAF